MDHQDTQSLPEDRESSVTTRLRASRHEHDEGYGTFSATSSSVQSHSKFRSSSSTASSSRQTLDNERQQETKSLLRSPLLGTRGLKPSIRLENSGSVARDHLALERTFLAYIRTSLAISMAGIGMLTVSVVAYFAHSYRRFIGIAQLFSLSYHVRRDEALPFVLLSPERLAKPIAAALILTGLLVLTSGTPIRACTVQPPTDLRAYRRRQVFQC